MRVLFLTNFYPPADRGGWEQWCQEVADAFTIRGHEVWVLTSNYGAGQIEQPEGHVRRSLYLESDVEHYQPADFFLRLGQRDRHNARVVQETIEEFDPEAIFIWGMWQLDPRLARMAEEMRPGRVAYYFCGYWPIEPDPHRGFWLGGEKRAFAAAIKKPLARVAMARQRRRAGQRPRFRQAAFVSRAVQDILEKGGVKFGKTRVIYGGIDLEQFIGGQRDLRDNDGESRLRMMYGGSLSAAKGVDTLLKATALLAQEYGPERFHLTLVGAGHPEFESWANLYVAEQGIQEYVTFSGRVGHSEIAELLKRFDALAFPSTWQEPLARMMMEGLAAGLALVSTTTGGSGEVLVDGVNSLTFEAGDERAMARQIGRLLDEPELLERLSRNGRATATELFEFERMVDQLEAFVGQLSQG